LVYVKIEEAKFAANEPRNPRQTLKRNRSKQKKKFSKVRIVEGESDYDDEDEDYVRIKHEIGEGEDEDGAPEVRSANKVVKLFHCSYLYSSVSQRPGWEFTKLLTQICNTFLNFKMLLWSSYS